MYMESDVYQRIRRFVKSKSMTISELAENLKLNQYTLRGKLNGSRELDLPTIELIIQNYPELSAEWLLRGKEPMVLSDDEGGADAELRDVCLSQAREIHRLKLQLEHLQESDKKSHAL